MNRFFQTAAASIGLLIAVSFVGVACAPRPEAGPAAQATVKWRTESEENNFGFFIERADSPEGPFVRVNDKIVAGHGTSNEPHEYRFVDSDVEAGRTYYYRLYSISYQNEQKLLGELKHKVKSADEAPEPTTESP